MPTNSRNAARRIVEVAGFQGTKDARVTVTAAETATKTVGELEQSQDKLFIDNCTYATITVPKCCLALNLTRCRHAEITVDRVMTVVEMIDCEDVTLRFTTLVKNIDVSKSKDILLDYTPAQEKGEVKDINVVTESWSQVKVGFMSGDKMIEKSLPTKIDHKLNLNDEAGEMEIETSPSALA